MLRSRAISKKVLAIYWNYFHWRSIIVNRFSFFALLIGPRTTLRLLGAKVAAASIHPSLILQNTQKGCCANLTIGRNVYIGPRCLFDLAASIEIQDECAIAADVKLITHEDVDCRPLRFAYPRKEGNITIGYGTWLCAGATVLQGVRVGPLAVVGAMSLVTRHIPERSVCFGIPAKVVKQIELPL